MNEKIKYGVNKKLKREATLISTRSARTTNISDDFNPKAIQCFYNTWKSKKYYVCMRVSYDNWYVMGLHYNLEAANNITHVIKIVRIVNLVNGFYLVCSCKLHTHVGTWWVHVAAIIDEVTPTSGTQCIKIIRFLLFEKINQCSIEQKLWMFGIY